MIKASYIKNALGNHEITLTAQQDFEVADLDGLLKALIIGSQRRGGFISGKEAVIEILPFKEPDDVFSKAKNVV